MNAYFSGRLIHVQRTLSAAATVLKTVMAEHDKQYFAWAAGPKLAQEEAEAIEDAAGAIALAMKDIQAAMDMNP